MQQFGMAKLGPSFRARASRVEVRVSIRVTATF